MTNSKQPTTEKPGKRKKASLPDTTSKLAKLEEPAPADMDMEPRPDVSAEAPVDMDVQPAPDAEQPAPDASAEHAPDAEQPAPDAEQPAHAPEGAIVGDDRERQPEQEFDELYYKNLGYARRNNGKEEYYAMNKHKSPYYYKEIYATKVIKVGDTEHIIEYPTTNNGVTDYIKKDGFPRYPQNLTTKEIIFHVNPDTNQEEYPSEQDGTLHYPTNSDGRPFYRKNADGDHVPMIENEYAEDEEGNQYYPQRANKDEFYLRADSHTEKPAMRKVGDSEMYYYAKKANGDEFYPRQYLRLNDIR